MILDDMQDDMAMPADDGEEKEGMEAAEDSSSTEEA